MLASSQQMVKPFKEDLAGEQIAWLYKQVEDLRLKKDRKKKHDDEHDDEHER